MGKRVFLKKKRNANNRREKPIMLIVSEGRNVTERQYFLSFQDRNGKYTIKFPKTGHVTDPVNLLKEANLYWEKYELLEDKGDKAYVVIDLDCLDDRANIINRLAINNNVKFIVSNPCVEVWFLLHYRYSTFAYNSGNDVKRDMRNFIPGYEESMDVANILRPQIACAMNNVRRLKQHFQGTEWVSPQCNPMTDIYRVIEELEII